MQGLRRSLPIFIIGCLIIALSIFLSALHLGDKLQPIVYDEEEFDLDDLYAMPDDDRLTVDGRPTEEAIDDRQAHYGSDELKKFIDSFDNRIESLREELGSEYQQIKSTHSQTGVVFEEDHSVVDSQYIAIPKEEYTK